VRSALDPDGTVTVAGQVWSAHAQAGRLDAGQPIRVLGRTGLVLDVERAETLSRADRNGAIG
jgi:membrane-bound ClpP family serine protease